MKPSWHHEVEDINPSDHQRVLDVWEASVRATHDFLDEEEILLYKNFIFESFLPTAKLKVIRNSSRNIMAIMATDSSKIEMLFVHPDVIGSGMGTALLNHAISELGITHVDVNEENKKATAFYLAAGFGVERRSPIDGWGKPHPVLHLVRFQ